MGNCAYRSISTFSSFLVLIVTYGSNAAERETLPTEEHALSLWLITRTGWVLCDRAAEYSKKIDKQFDPASCKQCYVTLFNKYKSVPKNVTNDEIRSCAEKFGVNRAFIPSIGFPPSPIELIHQNPFESIAVQPFTCNSALTSSQEYTPKNSNRPRFRQLPLPSLRQMTQLLSLQGFSYKNDPKVDYPRRSYVTCLLGAMFETELSLCPMNPDRRRCAAQKKEADEDLILSKSVPISYKGGILNEGQIRSMQYSNW